MNIQGISTTLRAIEEEDLTVLHKWSNNTELQKAMGNIHFPSSRSFHKSWFEKTLDDTHNQRFAIETKDHGLIGISSLMKIDWRNNNAWHGIMLGDKDTRGKGYAFDAVMATMRYAFDELHLNRLDGQMIEYNIASIKFYCKKLGWKEEGRAREWYYTQGRYWDRVIVGITKKDYLQLVEETGYWN